MSLSEPGHPERPSPGQSVVRALRFSPLALATDPGAARAQRYHDGVREMLAALSAAGIPVILAAGIPPAGLPLEETLYVGATAEELEWGRAAGMTIAAALWAGAERERLAALAPEWVFDRPADVTRTFAAWC